MYVTGNEIGPVLFAELTFVNGQVGKEEIKSGTEAIVDATIHDYNCNDLIKSFKIKDAAGNIVAQG